jgi:hypothetical protein
MAEMFTPLFPNGADNKEIIPPTVTTLFIGGS